MRAAEEPEKRGDGKVHADFARVYRETNRKTASAPEKSGEFSGRQRYCLLFFLGADSGVEIFQISY